MAVTPSSCWETPRIILGYCLIGFTNTIVPSIIFASAYLIVPYPRWVVVLLQTLPAVVAKLLVPRVASNIHHGFRPLLLAILWAIATTLGYLCPPNVAPPMRIVSVFLASFAAAAGDVTWLGLLRNYGRNGLVGWGIGTGAGSIVCAVLSYVLTVHMGRFLRTGLDYVMYLVPIMLFSHYLVLPTTTRLNRGREMLRDGSSGPRPGKMTDYELVPQSSASSDDTVTQQRPLSPTSSVSEILAHSIKSFVLPLFIASACRALIFPGLSRTMGTDPGFTSYSGFVAGYGLAFQAGNFITRSSPFLSGLVKTRTAMVAAASVAGFTGLNAVLIIVSSTTLLFPIVFFAGALTGAIYMETFGLALSQLSYDPTEANKEKKLGVIGVGEPAGIIAGALVNCVAEAALCSGGTDGDRWCFTVA